MRNRCLVARNHLARATINQAEAAGNTSTSNLRLFWVHPAVREFLDSWVRRFPLLSTSSGGGGGLTKAGDCGEKSRFLGGSVLPLWARKRSSSRRVRSRFYKIWQSVSQCGALSRVKYLDVLPSNSQNGCLVSSVDFLTSAGVTPGSFLPINKLCQAVCCLCRDSLTP